MGDIRPQNVFLNVDGKIKVATVNSWPMETTAQQKAFDHNVVYIAPEDMKKLELSLMDANDSDSS